MYLLGRTHVLPPITGDEATVAAVLRSVADNLEPVLQGLGVVIDGLCERKRGQHCVNLEEVACNRVTRVALV